MLSIFVLVPWRLGGDLLDIDEWRNANHQDAKELLSVDLNAGIRRHFYVVLKHQKD